MQTASRPAVGKCISTRCWFSFVRVGERKERMKLGFSLKWYFLVPFKSGRGISIGEQNLQRIVKPRLLYRNFDCSFEAVPMVSKVPIRDRDFHDWKISVYSSYYQNWITPIFAWIIFRFVVSFFQAEGKKQNKLRWRLRWLQRRLESFKKKVPLCRYCLYDDVSLSLCLWASQVLHCCLGKWVSKCLFI